MDMLELLRKLPDEIEEAIEFDVPHFDEKPARIFLGGMGGSAISGDVAKLVMSDLDIPFEIIRDYRLPTYAGEKDILVASSYSGNTEESLSLYEDGLSRNMKILIITSGGKLLGLAQKNNNFYVKIPSGFPPRTALGYLFTPIVMTCVKSGFVGDHHRENLKKLPDFMRNLQKEFESVDSLPLEIAKKLYFRFPIIYTSRRIYPVALRWKAQINENAKAFAHIMDFPEMNHNEIAGIKNPKERVEALWAIFIEDIEDYERIRLRFRHTMDLIRDSVMGITHILSRGNSTVERVFYLIYLGDYVSYYLAKLYNEDPVAIPRIDELKRRLSK